MDKKEEKENKVKRNQEALQPISPTLNVPPPEFIRDVINKAQIKEKKLSEADDNVIVEGAQSDFWKLIKNYIERYQKDLKAITSELVQQGQFDLNAIGMKYLLSDQISNALQKVIDYVENRARIVEQMKRDAQELEKAKAKLEEKKRR
jgi:archaellum component FlaC